MNKYWCEHCTDWFRKNHYDEEGLHIIGQDFGDYGKLLAKAEELEFLQQENNHLKARILELEDRLSNLENEYFAQTADPARPENT